MICSFDIDGVIFNGPGLPGLIPGPNDIIVTGRSYEETTETVAMLARKGIFNPIYLSPVTFDEKTREISGHHKAEVLNRHPEVAIHYEDDEIQADIIRQRCPHVTVILLTNPLMGKENKRHLEY